MDVIVLLKVPGEILDFSLRRQHGHAEEVGGFFDHFIQVIEGPDLQ